MVIDELISKISAVLEITTQKSDLKMYLLIMRENMLLYTAGKKFTLLPAVTNLTSGNTAIIWRDSAPHPHPRLRNLCKTPNFKNKIKVSTIKIKSMRPLRGYSGYCPEFNRTYVL